VPLFRRRINSRLIFGGESRARREPYFNSRIEKKEKKEKKERKKNHARARARVLVAIRINTFPLENRGHNEYRALVIKVTIENINVVVNDARRNPFQPLSA